MQQEIKSEIKVRRKKKQESEQNAETLAKLSKKEADAAARSVKSRLTKGADIGDLKLSEELATAMKLKITGDGDIADEADLIKQTQAEAEESHLGVAVSMAGLLVALPGVDVLTFLYE